jgi:hypothetical protein
VFSLPQFYDEARALAHVETLKSPASPSINVFGDVFGDVFGAADNGRRKVSLPLGSGEARAFSYGALYYPWLVGQGLVGQGLIGQGLVGQGLVGRANGLPATPPDGAACGVMAGRALRRGAWIAPANELLRGVIALEPPPVREQFLKLQEAQINFIRQEPRGFLALSADTLSVDDDEDLRPINVRRLLILLRRLALRLGATYVFEPNDDSFRRLVQRGFEAALDSLFERGAFAGATPAASYQVVADSRLNALEQEQGRFIVEIKVAPSLPMTFLTIRVIHTGDRTLVTETGF